MGPGVSCGCPKPAGAGPQDGGGLGELLQCKCYANQIRTSSSPPVSLVFDLCFLEENSTGDVCIVAAY